MPVSEENGCKLVRFGFGDVIITKARKPEKTYEDEICLIPDSRSYEPGSRMEQERWDALYANKSSDDVPCAVRLQFDNIAGLDALIAELTELREVMVSATSDVTAT